MKVDKQLIKGSTIIMILAQLERKPMYGYEMIKEIEKSSGGIFAFKEGTLYPILHSLESEGMLESFWTGTEGSRRRRYYRITNVGNRFLQEKREEWGKFYLAVNKVIGEGFIWT